ncbi:hypothetical protein [Hyphomonas sp.]|uniref:hypothetical protein n=1 Tax=Hyphomonas sp. TaxID=87 RepID=UPI00391C62FE
MSGAAMQAGARAVPFEFRADFAAPEMQADAGPDSIRLTAEEVFALITKVRRDTLAEAARGEVQAALAQVEAVAGTLREVMGDMVQLMGQIEAAGYEAAVEARMRVRLEAAARRLIDGQGELFGAAATLSRGLDKPASGGAGSGL